MFIVHAFDKRGHEVLNSGRIQPEEVEEITTRMELVLQSNGFDHYSILVQEVFD